MKLEIPKAADVIKGALAERGNWVVASVSTNIAWPIHAQRVSYRAHDVWVLPIMENFHASVAIMRPDELARSEAEILLSRFLSSLSWVESSGAIIEFITGGNLPRPMGTQKKFGYSIRDRFELDYLPEPSDEKAMLALALMREGRALNHPAYSFLSLYRAFEVCVPGKERGEWISKNIQNLRSHTAKKALDKIRAKGVQEIGNHLRETCRSAIAHANSDPIIDPDRPADGRMLQEASPIMDALAELAIEERLNIQTAYTVFKEHLYELAGFRKVLGEHTVAAIISGKIEQDSPLDLPNFDVRIRGKERYSPLSGLIPVNADVSNSVLYLTLSSKDERWLFKIALDFPKERLNFDIFNGVYQAAADDGSPEFADETAELHRFFKDYFGNGVLMIFNAETNTLLSRCDPFIPRNMIANPEGSNAIAAEWRAKALERRKTADAATDQGGNSPIT